jgi:N6-L-threonylcarbamoyladenine synthase
LVEFFVFFQSSAFFQGSTFPSRHSRVTGFLKAKLYTLHRIHYTDCMNILAIETSCDDTAVALVKAECDRFFVVDEYVSSQTKVHSPFGGVVPNLAAREHLKNLPLLLKKIIAKNKIKPENIDFIAVTEGPGLIPALLIGTNAAKALAYAWKKPLVGVHHVAGHIYSNFLQGSTFLPPTLRRGSSRSNLIKFPILALIVSGGHTELIFMKKHMDFKIIGQTLDDAAGEAFDKVAKILNLGYPGGPIVSKLAEKFQASAKARLAYQSPTFPSLDFSSRDSSKSDFSLPRPMINSKDFNFSFSGLKTAVLYTVRDNPRILKNDKLKAALCAEFQQAAIDVLVSKTIRAAKKFQPKTILLGGGVSANQELRKQLDDAIKKQIQNTRYQIPNTKYTQDNAAMIAAAGYFQWKLSKNKNQFSDNWKTLEANASLKLK